MRAPIGRALLGLALTAAGVCAADELAEVGKVAPAFRLPVYNAKVFGEPALGLDRWVGPDAPDKQAKAVLVSFMASFCAPCKKELPYLEALHQKHRAQGLRVVAISIDAEPAGQKQIEELIEQHQVTFPVLKDRFTIVARRWLGARSPLPSLFMVRPDGTIATVHRGYSQDGVALLGAEVEAALAGRR